MITKNKKAKKHLKYGWLYFCVIALLVAMLFCNEDEWYIIIYDFFCGTIVVGMIVVVFSWTLTFLD